MTQNKEPSQNNSSQGEVKDLISDFVAPKRPPSAPTPAPEQKPEPVSPAPSAPQKPAPAAPKKETPAKKKAPAKKSPSARSSEKPKKGTSASQADRNTPQKSRDTVSTSTGKPRKPAKAQKESKTAADGSMQPRSAKLGHRIFPYVLIVLAVFIGISLLLNLFCNQGNKLAGTPGAHWMGLVGYYLCFGLFSAFGPAAFLLPFLLLNLAFFWKKFIDSRVTTLKILASLLLMVLLATLIHAFNLIPLKDQIADYCKLDYLITSGSRMTGGGIVGGKIAYFLISFLNIAGTAVLGIVLFLIALFYCIGMTPQHIWNRYRTHRARKRAERADIEEGKLRAKELEEKSKKEAKTEAPAQKEEEQPTPKPSREEEKIAPMPMPLLDPSHGTRPFVPVEVKQGLTNQAKSATVVQTAQGQTPTSTVVTAPQYGNRASIVESLDSATPQNQDSAVDPIFPRAADKVQRKVPKQDRNFDLKNVFIDLDGGESQNTPTVRKHATLPPEVPMKGDPHPAEPAPQPVKQAPATPARTPAQAAPKGEKPIFRQDTSMGVKDYGLSNEEFERLEAEKNLPSTKSGDAPKDKAEAAKMTVGTPKTALVKNNKKYVFPPISYLHPGEPMNAENRAEIEASMSQLAETLQNFNVRIKEINYACGPTVTRYEVFPAPGVRVRSFVNLADDISLALAAGGIRIEAPIPGKSAVGVEVPNKTRCTVYLRDLIESKAFRDSSSKLTASLGADITGKPLLFDVSKMPHLLVAGTTGSGKSVCINCIIISLLYKARPDEVKLVLIDPKKVEFSIYKNIPHLMAPIVTTPKDAAGALQAAVEEMEHRFELFEQVGVHDIKGFNEMTKNDPDMPFLPQIVIIIDELADLMMTAPDEVETAICRIAQKARAAGMHLIVGTQRPSVDVVTGLIKSNIPSRIAFTVASQVDSKTILDYAGAEKLAGRGDMLFAPIGALKPSRVQGAYVDEKEVERVCEFIRATNGMAQYDEKFISKLKELAAQCGNKGKGGGGGDSLPGAEGDGKSDNKYADAVRVAVEEKRISTSLLQRKLEIGYSRAAKIIDRMQSEGIVSAPDGAKPRSVLITPEEYIARFIEGNEGDAE
ncbi:MAG: DNA translocase FtsK 4TM domain-containing protein [Clostridia bacterium]|nr:DNA translocase FtsK 4TM domain-containing protein [Clostridia bacterium]